MTGCMTNRRLPWLVAWPITDDTMICLTNHRYSRRGLVLGSGVDATSKTGAHAAPPVWPLLDVCMYIHLPFCIWMWPLPFLGTISSALHCQEVERIFILMLDWAPFYVQGKSGHATSIKVIQLVVISHNWSLSQLYDQLAVQPIVRLVWPWPIIDHHDWWHDWSYNHIQPICSLLQFGIAKPEFWTWPLTLLQLICSSNYPQPLRPIICSFCDSPTVPSSLGYA